MANADKTLQDKDYVNIYPITRERNVYDENNVNLKEKFKNVIFGDNEVFKFSKEQYEESANITETENDSGTVGGVEYVSFDNKTTLNGTATSSNDIWLKLKYPIKAGTTFSFNQFANNSELNQGGIWLAKGINDWTNRVQVYGGKENISLNYDINYISIHLNSGTTYSSYYITPMAVLGSEKPTNYFRYNPNRHITNSEAEFLKDEHNKSLNLISEEFKKITDYHVQIGYIYGLKPNTTYSYKLEATNIYGSNLNLVKKGVSSNSIIQNIITDWGLDLTSKAVTFTTNNDVNENEIYFLEARGTYNDTTTATNAMLVEGSYTFATMPSYVPYNSSSHITNGQADLLRNEHEKQLNLMKSITIETGTTYQYGASIYGEFDNRVEVGKTYTLVFDTENTGASFYRNEQIFEQTFSFNADGKRKVYIGKIISLSGNVLFKNNLDNSGKLTSTCIKNVMLLEGDWSNKPIPNYQEWHGEIIHEKDITPVLLWENGNPNAEEFAGYQASNLSEPLTNKPYFYIEWKVVAGSTIGSKIEKFSSKYSNYAIMGNLSDGTNARRVFDNNNTRINWGNGMRGTTEDNKVIIPIRIMSSDY